VRCVYGVSEYLGRRHAHPCQCVEHVYFYFVEYFVQDIFHGQECYLSVYALRERPGTSVALFFCFGLFVSVEVRLRRKDVVLVGCSLSLS